VFPGSKARQEECHKKRQRAKKTIETIKARETWDEDSERHKAVCGKRIRLRQGVKKGENHRSKTSGVFKKENKEEKGAGGVCRHTIRHEMMEKSTFRHTRRETLTQAERKKNRGKKPLNA